MDKIDKWLFGVVNVVNILDAVTTYIGITVFGLTEGNPFVNWHIGVFGLIISLFVKIVLVAGLLYWLIRIKKKNEKNWHIPIVYGYLIILFGYAVVNNLYHMFTVLVHS